MSAPPPSFDALIQADRKKRENEKLAAQMLGSGRRKNPGASIDRRATASPSTSLASRVGIQKRSSSSASIAQKPSINGRWNHDLHGEAPGRLNGPFNAPPRGPARSSPASVVDRSNRIYAGMQKDLMSNTYTSSSQSTLRNSTLRNNNPSASNGTRSATAASMSIKGMASTSSGPYVVIASNFAPGTTAADIEAAMVPVGGEVASCALVSAKPTVMAEICFVEREGAENVVATFNNQMADGRMLYVYMKAGGPSPHLHKFNVTSASASAGNLNSNNNSNNYTTTAPSSSRTTPRDRDRERERERERQAAILAPEEDIMEVDEDTYIEALPAPIPVLGAPTSPAHSAPAPVAAAAAAVARDDERARRDQQRYEREERPRNGGNGSGGFEGGRYGGDGYARYGRRSGGGGGGGGGGFGGRRGYGGDGYGSGSGRQEGRYGGGGGYRR